MANERTTNPNQRPALNSQAKPCYDRSMASEESVEDAAKRIKAKMEGYGYTPTLLPMAACVDAACSGRIGA